jgi:tetratricopeptide (TPR) repeat protein
MRRGQSGIYKRFVGGLAALALIGCMLLSRAELDHWRTSATLWRHAIALTGGSSTGHQNLGLALLPGDKEAAFENFQAALRFDPSDPNANVELGRLLLERGNVEGAVRHFQTALDAEPKCGAAHHFLGRVLLSHGQLDEAASHLRVALQLVPDQATGLGAAVESDLGLCLLQQGQLDKAAALFADVLRLDPERAEAHYHLGLALLRRGERDRAAACFRDTLRLNPRDELAHLNLGIILKDQGDSTAAQRELRAALELDRTLAAGHYHLGALLLEHGLLDQATPHLDQAASLNHDAAPLVQLAILGEKQGDWPGAVARLRQALQVDATDAAVRRELAYCLQQQGQDAAARREYQEALRLDAEWPARQTRRAWLLATHPDPERRHAGEALRLAQQACQATNDQDANALDALAAAHAEAGKFMEAAALAQRAAERAAATGDERLAQQIRQRRELYEKKQSFRSVP